MRALPGRALAVALFLVAGCGSAQVPSAPLVSPIDIAIVFTPVGDGSSFSAQLNDQTYTKGGKSIATLTPGTHQITGSFHGSGFGVGFETLGAAGGGIRSGSPRSLAGPSLRTTVCAITYTNSDTPDVERNFQLLFEVTVDVGSACAGSPP